MLRQTLTSHSQAYLPGFYHLQYEKQGERLGEFIAIMTSGTRDGRLVIVERGWTEVNGSTIAGSISSCRQATRMRQGTVDC